jgi:hypothetical protein
MIRLSNGIELPSIGLGTFKATGESVQVAVKAAVQCGITHIDTAAIYKVRLCTGCIEGSGTYPQLTPHGAGARLSRQHLELAWLPSSTHHFNLMQLTQVHAG